MCAQETAARQERTQHTNCATHTTALSSSRFNTASAACAAASIRCEGRKAGPAASAPLALSVCNLCSERQAAQKQAAAEEEAAAVLVATVVVIIAHSPPRPNPM